MGMSVWIDIWMFHYIIQLFYFLIPGEEEVAEVCGAGPWPTDLWSRRVENPRYTIQGLGKIMSGLGSIVSCLG